MLRAENKLMKEPKYILDGNFAQEGNNFFIIDFNKIRSNWESMRK